MSETEAAQVRAEEREAVLRLAREVAADAARASGQKDGAEAAANFIAFVLTQAYAKRDQELGHRAAGNG